MIHQKKIALEKGGFMPKIKVVDHIGLSMEKLDTEKKILNTLLETLPGYRIGSPTHPFRIYYTSYVEGDGPSHKYLGNNLEGTHFGILGPKPADTRLKLFNLPIGFGPLGELVAVVEIYYRENKGCANNIRIQVYGIQNKKLFYSFVEKLRSKKLSSLVSGTVTLELKSPEPRLEGEGYLNF